MKQPPRNIGREPAWLVRAPRRLQISVFVLVSAVSLLGVFGIEHAESQRRHAALERSAADIAAAMRQIDTEQEIFLRASAALLAAHDPVSAADFQQSQRELKFDYRRQGALGTGWLPRDRSGQPGGAPAIVYGDPAAPPNAVALPSSAGAGAIGRAAMEQAAAIDAPVATGRITPAAADIHSGRPDFVIYMPVFAKAAPPRAGRSGALAAPAPAPVPILRGYVFMPFQAAAVLAIVYQRSAHERVHVAAYDRSVAPDRLMARIGEAGTADGQLIEQVEIARHPWQLVVSAGRPAGLSRLSQITILSGLIVALLLAVLIRMTYQKMKEERALLEWQASEAGIRNSLTRELNHRVKNTLATVLSIVALTRRRETDLDSYVASLSGRIRALSATHDLLTSNDWSSVELRQIVTTELAPYLDGSGDHVSLDGPDIRLAPNDSLTLGLAVHELATNAAKYGALSLPSGRIAVCWRQLDTDMVEVHWQESGGPAVTTPQKRGFGRELIEKILARELDSPVRLDFAPDGLQCVFRVPLRKPSFFMLRNERAAAPGD